MRKAKPAYSDLSDPVIVGIRTRGVILMALCLIFLLAVGARLWVVQATYPGKYVELERFNNIHTGQIPAYRGRIFDAYGRPLADNRITYSLFVNPNLVVAEHRDELVGVLNTELGIDIETARQAVERTDSYRQILIREMTEEDIQNFNDLPSYGPAARITREVGIMSHEARVYPLGPVAGPVIGFTAARDDGQVGLWGLESSYNEVLTGRSGIYRDLRDQRGNRIPGSREELAPPRNGSDLSLTIDGDIQALAENALADGLERTNAIRGAVIITEPSTGAVRALVSAPALDPSNFEEYLEDETALFSMPTCLSYEAGSAMKIFTIAVGLEEGVVTPEEILHVGVRELPFRGGRVPDHEYGPVDLSLRDVFVHSSNRGAAIIAVRLGYDRMRDYFRDFGFGERTCLQMPGEPAGSLKEWQNPFPEIDLANMGFGHGITVSPLQLAQAAGVIANDGMLVPLRLIQARRDPPWGAEVTIEPGEPYRVISSETARIVLGFMEGVVEEGTAMQARTEWSCAGKTGTAQKVDPETCDYYDDRFFSTFVGFGPTPDPKWLIVVILDEPDYPYFGGAACGPIFREIFNGLMLREGREPVEIEDDEGWAGDTLSDVLQAGNDPDGDVTLSEFVISPDPFGDTDSAG